MLYLPVYSVTVHAHCRWLLLIHVINDTFVLHYTVVSINVSSFIVVIVGVFISYSLLYIYLPANGSIDKPGNPFHESKLLRIKYAVGLAFG